MVNFFWKMFSSLASEVEPSWLIAFSGTKMYMQHGDEPMNWSKVPAEVIQVKEEPSNVRRFSSAAPLPLVMKIGNNFSQISAFQCNILPFLILSMRVVLSWIISQHRLAPDFVSAKFLLSELETKLEKIKCVSVIL